MHLQPARIDHADGSFDIHHERVAPFQYGVPDLSVNEGDAYAVVMRTRVGRRAVWRERFMKANHRLVEGRSNDTVFARQSYRAMSIECGTKL